MRLRLWGMSIPWEKKFVRMLYGLTKNTNAVFTNTLFHQMDLKNSALFSHLQSNLGSPDTGL